MIFLHKKYLDSSSIMNESSLLYFLFKIVFFTHISQTKSIQGLGLAMHVSEIWKVCKFTGEPSNENYFCLQELRQMDSMEHGNPQNSVRRNTIFSAETMSDQSHLKTEVVLLQRKYERLQQKERRMQVLINKKLPNYP